MKSKINAGSFSLSINNKYIKNISLHCNYFAVSGQSTHRTQYSPTRLSDDFYAQERVKSSIKSYREAPGEHDITSRIKKIEKSAKEKRLESAGVNGDFKIPRDYEVRYIKEVPKRVANCARAPNRVSG